MNLEKRKEWLTYLVLFLWTFLVGSNYFFHHPSYYLALSSMPYLSTILGLFVVMGGAYFAFIKTKMTLRGWKIYLVGLICMLIIFHGFATRANLYSAPIAVHWGYFIGKNLYYHLGILFIFANSYAFGKGLLPLFKVNLKKGDEQVVSMVLGILGFTFLGFLLGAFKLLYVWTVIPLHVLVAVWQRKALLEIFKSLFWNPIKNVPQSNWTRASIALLLPVIAFNMVGAIKYFPIGFDAASVYQNISNLIFDSHQLIGGMPAYNWSLFTSMGAIFFNSMNFSIFLSHATGLLVIWGMYRLLRHFISRESSWVAIAVFYSLPALSYLNFVDAKVDLGFAFILVAGLLALINFAKNKNYQLLKIEDNTARFFGLLGLIFGFAMGVKYLAILGLFGICGVLAFEFAGKKGLLSALLLMVSAMIALRVDEFGSTTLDSSERLLLVGILSILGLGLLGFVIKQQPKEKTVATVKILSILLLGFFLSFSPWLVKHGLESKSISMDTLIFGGDQESEFKYFTDYINKSSSGEILNKKLKNFLIEELEKNHNLDVQGLSDAALVEIAKKTIDPARYSAFQKVETLGLQNTAKQEEIQRYLGYEPGFPRYLSLPYDLTMNSNIKLERGLNIGFLFFLFLPFLFFSFGKEKSHRLKNSLAGLTLLFIFLISWKSVFDNVGLAYNLADYQSLLSKEKAGDLAFLYQPVLFIQHQLAALISPVYALMAKMNFSSSIIGLFLIASLFTWFFQPHWKKITAALQLLLLFFVTYSFLWWIFGNGITFYAIIAVIGMMGMVFFLYENWEKIVGKGLQPIFKKWSKLMIGSLLVANFFLHFTNFSNQWNDPANAFFYPFLQNVSSNGTHEDMMSRAFSNNHKGLQTINNNLEGKVYRVGTFANYHIKNNHLRVFEDNQLGTFDQWSKNLNDKNGYLDLLKRSGFKYIVFDMKIASIDQTADKTLQEKAMRFVKILNNREKIKLISTDRRVRQRDKKTGQTKVVFGLSGEIVDQGSMSIFELK